MTPSSALSGIQYSAISNRVHDPNGPDNRKTIMYYDEARGDFLQPPQKHLTPATVNLNIIWWQIVKDPVESSTKFNENSCLGFIEAVH